MTSTERVPVSELLNLSGQVALVTGASGNIGAAIAHRLHEAGAQVVLHHSGHEAGARSVLAMTARFGGNAFAVAGDVERDAAAICQNVRAELGRIDVLVNNAAIQPVGALRDLSQSDISEMLRVNVAGVIAMTSQATARMAAGSAVVNIASIEGQQPAVGHSHYAAAKAAVLMHTRAAAGELGPAGIRVNAVSPGLIRADGIHESWPQGVARWEAACPLGRMGEATDVADAVLFLASPAARWITGANLIVDGGILTRNTW